MRFLILLLFLIIVVTAMITVCALDGAASHMEQLKDTLSYISPTNVQKLPHFQQFEKKCRHLPDEYIHIASHISTNFSKCAPKLFKILSEISAV